VPFTSASIFAISPAHGVVTPITGFVGLDFDDLLIRLHVITRLYVDRDDRGFGHRFAELRHRDWNLWHKITPPKSAAPWLRWTLC
jgi:hypothetical protein